MHTRRRFLTIAATIGAASSLPRWVRAAQPTPVSDWRGTALGAPASMRLVHPDRQYARQTIQQCMAEIARLEHIFSLYQPQSALRQLNGHGVLEAPPFELLEVLSFALQLARYSQGHFDPTMQPLYDLYAQHFARPDAPASGPGAAALAQALDKVDYRQVAVDPQAIRLLKPGMAISLNGVAQGYITDKIAALLARRGFDDILIDIGEIRASGQRPDGQPWTASLAHPTQRDRNLLRMHLGAPGASTAKRPVHGPALATSSGAGSPFGAAAASQSAGLPDYHHLLNPHTGQSARHYLSVSVAAANAMTADGLSTALSVIDPEKAPDLLSHWPRARAWLLPVQGPLFTLS